MTASDLIEFIRAVPVFSCLSEKHLEQLSRIAVTRAFPRDTIIFHEGDYADAFYLILEGKVKVALGNEDGKEIIISLLKRGQYFGELALIDDETRSARIVAMTACRVALFGRAAFYQLIKAEPTVSREFMKSLAQRLRQTNRHMGDLVLLDVFGRVTRVLLEMARESGGELRIRDVPTQREIASMVGATRESVNKIMKDLVDRGYVAMRGKDLVLNMTSDVSGMFLDAGVK